MRNTHTSKKYAIDLINEFRAKALANLQDEGRVSTEPCLITHKQDAVSKGTAVYKPMPKIKQACRLKVNTAIRQRNSRYNNHVYNTAVEIEELIETPESYKEALRVHKRELPKQKKLIAKIDAAHDEAERAIMLGGSDTQIAKAVAKLEKLLNG